MTSYKVYWRLSPQFAYTLAGTFDTYDSAELCRDTFVDATIEVVEDGCPNNPVAWMYVTEVCNRFEETEYPASVAERMYREKILEVVPLYSKVLYG